MTTVTSDSENIIIEMEGIDKILALKSHLKIPINHISSVSQNTKDAKKWLGIKGIKKIAGSNLPGIISEGTFYDNEMVFLEIHHPEKTISIFLKDEKYKEIIIEVNNANQIINDINRLINKHPFNKNI